MKHPFVFDLSRVRVLLAGRDTVHATTTTIWDNFKTCALHMQRTVQIHKRSIFCAPSITTIIQNWAENWQYNVGSLKHGDAHIAAN